MKVDCRVPARGEVELAELLTAQTGEPYADDMLELCARFANRLMADPIARVHPELMTLAFFMRRSELVRMKREFEAGARPDVVRTPRGLIFHVPPANVDTIFMYSWVLAMLAGNANIVRLSSRSSSVVDHICGLLDELLAAPDLAARSRVAMIRYGHDDAITAAISARADLRMIWGGDASIDAIRRAPLAPASRDLTFADRWSMMALDAAAVAGLDGEELAGVAERVYDDVFWFDQLACSSPRLCLWIGDRATVASARRLWAAVAAVAMRRVYQLDVADRLARELFVHRAVLDQPVIGRIDHEPLVILELDQFDAMTREPAVTGLLYEAIAPSLDILDPWIRRKDQTLTHYGIARDDLIALARRLGGRGLDRMVPVGSALKMSRVWDGYDLAAELVRHVQVIA